MATYTDNYNLTKPTFAEVADIRTINGNMDTIDDIMHASQVSLADAYDQTATYNTGDVVMYEFLMYKCKEDNVTGNWDATKWERTTAAETGGEASDLSVKVPEVISTGDKACYVKRAIPTAGALAEGQKLIGATLAWNQLAKADKSSAVQSGVTFTNNSDGSWNLSGTPTINNCFYNLTTPQNGDMTIKPDHVYFMSSNSGKNKVGFSVQAENASGFQTAYCFINDLIFKSSNFTVVSTTKTWARLQVTDYANTDIGTVTVTPQIIDLTQLFGSTIADAIYQMEQTTAGSGVAFFRKYFPEDYYAYGSGELESVNVSAHMAVGFNQWDEEWESGTYNGTTGAKQNSTTALRNKNPIKIIKGVDYFGKFDGVITSSNNVLVFMYDDGMNYLGNTQVTNTQPNKVIALAEGTSYINFCWIGSTYNNDICVNISNNTKNGQYEPYTTNTVTLDSSKEFRGLYKLVDGELRADGDIYEADGTVTRKYGYRAYQSGDESLVDAITDGTNTVYKLTTPTTESATPYTNPQLVDADGTEEFVDYKVSQGTRDVAVPVGHESSFYDYTDGTLTVPDLPFADGTYALSVTMNNGTPTFSWEGGN